MGEFKNIIRDAFGLRVELDLDREEQTVEAVVRAFRTRSLFYLVVGSVYSLAVLVVAILCGIQMFATADTNARILWAMGFGVSAIWLLLLKIFWWVMSSKLSTLREIKLLELQIAELAEQRRPED
jgi:hypothetical protein